MILCGLGSSDAAREGVAAWSIIAGEMVIAKRRRRAEEKKVPDRNVGSSSSISSLFFSAVLTVVGQYLDILAHVSRLYVTVLPIR